MIDIRQLHFQYPYTDFSLRIPQLQVNSGETVAVVGPSGSGKTTLLNIISGILLPQSGSVVVNDCDVARLSESQRRLFRLQQVGMVFQNFELIEYLNVIDNVLLPCRISGSVSLNDTHRQRAAVLLSSVGMEPHLRRSVTRLSQGERQRVAICRALLNSPSLLLADEPTGNLDPVTSDRIMHLLLETARQQRATLIMVTHDHSLLHHFDRTIDFAQYLTATQAPTPGSSL